jgi:hypothetical protein
MRFFFPDSQDVVDPAFNFASEGRDLNRLRMRDDAYAHEVLETRAYDGLLVSKGIVDGVSTGSRYTLAQRHRLYRSGAHEFFRVARPDRGGMPMPIMGDCGAFTYVNEDVPPFSVDEVLRFYNDCQFDMGISVDHVILAYQPEWDLAGAPADAVNRQQLTLTLAEEFLQKMKRYGLQFEPLGVAQGWSPKSYARSVAALQKMGYRYIAVGGMVPLRSSAILESLQGISEVRRSDVRLHLLGVTRTEHVEDFARFGVSSFDSTSPLRQAFKDDRDNYYTPSGAYTAIRIPQVQANAKLMKQIRAGRVSQEAALRLERACLIAMAEFDAGRRSVESVVSLLGEYETLYDPKKDHSKAYREVLEARPWRECSCTICRTLGYHVILFRGSERNRRRGFHNLWVFYRRLKGRLGVSVPDAKELVAAPPA